MKNLFLATLLLFVTGASECISGGTAPERETRNLSGFTKVSFGVAGELYINIGPEFKVVLEGEKSLLSEIETEVSGHRLIIRHEGWRFNDRGQVTVFITMPELSGLGVSGSGKAEIKDPFKAEKVDFSVSGSGRILTGDLSAGNIDVEISGSGNVIVGGTGDAESADISISGSGGYTGETLRIANGDFSISGSGNCKCYVTENLDASVSGSGSVIYSGNPKIDARVSGSGRVRSR